MASFANQIAASSEKVGGWVSSQGLRPVLFGKDTISVGALVLRILAIHFPASWRVAILNPLYSTSAISSFAPQGLACAFPPRPRIRVCSWAIILRPPALDASAGLLQALNQFFYGQRSRRITTTTEIDHIDGIVRFITAWYLLISLRYYGECAALATDWQQSTKFQVCRDQSAIVRSVWRPAELKPRE
jgi:hypothetical protein